jgi:predicted dehydrogenase
MSELRWGVLGAGRIARAFTRDLRAAAEGSGAGSVVAVGSRDLARAEAFGEEMGVARRYGSYAELAADATVDAVYVATHHPLHHEAATVALQHRKPTLVEKPFTMNAAEAADLVATARASGTFLLEAMWTRFLPHVAEIRRLLEEGALGEIVTVFADHGQWFPSDPGFRLFAPELGGGALLDLGIYPVSFASMVLGRPDRVEVLVTPAFTGVDGQTSVLLGHPGGAQAVLNCTALARTPSTAAICGTEARLEVPGAFYAPTPFEVVARDGSRRRVEAPHRGRGHWYQAAEVGRCLAAGLTESALMPLDETVSIMATMDTVLAKGSRHQTAR